MPRTYFKCIILSVEVDVVVVARSVLCLESCVCRHIVVIAVTVVVSSTIFFYCLKNVHRVLAQVLTAPENQERKEDEKIAGRTEYINKR